MVIKFDEIKNWATFSEKTKSIIKESGNNRLDAVGLLMTGNYNPTECVQIFQSLADPKYMGEIKNKFQWQRANFSGIDGLADSCEEYSKNGYSSYALKSNENTVGLTLPLFLNYTSNGKLKSKTCDKYDKIVSERGNFFPKWLGKDIEHSQYSIGKTYKESGKSIEIFKEVDGKQISEYDEIVLLSNLVAERLLAFEAKELKEERKQYKSEDLKVIDEVTKLLLTLGICRTINFGDPEASHEIDEALKLQISNAIATVETSSNHFVKTIVKQTTECMNDFQIRAEFGIESIVENMKANGFRYPKQPTTYAEAVFNVNNLTKVFDIQFKIDAAPKQKTGVSEANKKKLQDLLSGMFDSYVLSKKQRAEATTEANPYIDQTESLEYLLKNKDNLFNPISKEYSDLKMDIINKVLRRYEQQRSEDKGKNARARLKDVLNEEFSPQGEMRDSGVIIRNLVKNMIKNRKANAKGKIKLDDGQAL